MGRYPIVKSAAGPVAGVLEMPKFLQASGARPYWTGYVHTNLEFAQQNVKALGGQIFTPPSPSAMGTSFVFADSTGAVLSAFAPTEAFPVPSSTKQGEFCWQRLYSRDANQSEKFYSELLGWQIHQEFPDTNVLQNQSGEPVGDIQPRPSWLQTDSWVHFLGVNDLSKVSLTLEHGAGSLIEATRIGERSALVAKEPQGAIIGFIEV